MEHGSHYCYVGDRSDSDESLSDSERMEIAMDDLLEEGEEDSLFSESNIPSTSLFRPSTRSAPPVIRAPRSAPAATSSTTTSTTTSTAQEKKKKKAKKANVNVVSVNLKTLDQATTISTGDAVLCSNCQAGFNIHSVSTEATEAEGSPAKRLWKCEFCEYENQIDLAPEEMPTADAIDYLLEAAPETGNQEDESGVIFCIDISGSMCLTTEVQGRLQLKGNPLQRLAGLNTEGASQRLPNERRGVTYISRLQSVQAAVEASLSRIATDTPKKRVGLVTFNNEVTIHGDGSKQEPQTVTGDRLRNYDELLSLGESCEKEALAKPVKETQSILCNKIYDLEEGGATALGPAIVTSVGMAAARGPGSRVILCTDGKANVGLGSLDKIRTEEDAAKVEEWYSQLGRYAASKGVMISVISIKGDDCRMEYLGALAELTGGQVDIVDPMDITKEFSNILSKAVIATNCQVTLRLHKGLKIVTQEGVDGGHYVVQEVGNVNSETELTFEYCIAERKKLKERGITALPFQVQITFTRKDGAKILRIISQQQQVTHERARAEAEIQVEVMATHVAQQAARLAQEGEYSKARSLNVVNARMFQRSIKAQTSSSGKEKAKEKAKKVLRWARVTSEMNNDLEEAVQSEVAEGGNLSDDDNEDGSLADFRARMQRKKAKRKNSRNDQQSTRLYQMKSASSNYWK